MASGGSRLDRLFGLLTSESLDESGATGPVDASPAHVGILVLQLEQQPKSGPQLFHKLQNWPKQTPPSCHILWIE